LLGLGNASLLRVQDDEGAPNLTQEGILVKLDGTVARTVACLANSLLVFIKLQYPVLLAVISHKDQDNLA